MEIFTLFIRERIIIVWATVRVPLCFKVCLGSEDTGVIT